MTARAWKRRDTAHMAGGPPCPVPRTGFPFSASVTFDKINQPGQRHLAQIVPRNRRRPRRRAQGQVALGVSQDVQFRVHPALGAPDQPSAPPFLTARLEAVRCAFRWVASIITTSVAWTAIRRGGVRETAHGNLEKVLKLWYLYR